ncbi:spidroin-1-like [Panicum virgatum]|uniref:spidroin-1-like n=1 Tax=Panicum virgatum TaxID=38727 RepID=UPI0019D63900|nr:spidroin-1-like [Panicum virgatum]
MAGSGDCAGGSTVGVELALGAARMRRGPTRAARGVGLRVDLLNGGRAAGTRVVPVAPRPDPSPPWLDLEGRCGCSPAGGRARERWSLRARFAGAAAAAAAAGAAGVGCCSEGGGAEVSPPLYLRRAVGGGVRPAARGTARRGARAGEVLGRRGAAGGRPYARVRQGPCWARGRRGERAAEGVLGAWPAMRAAGGGCCTTAGGGAGRQRSDIAAQ